MRKLLFATTALVATASMAAAEIKFSGYGRFGLKNSDSEVTANDFHGHDAKSRIKAAKDAKDKAAAAKVAIKNYMNLVNAGGRLAGVKPVDKKAIEDDKDTANRDESRPARKRTVLQVVQSLDALHDAVKARETAHKQDSKATDEQKADADLKAALAFHEVFLNDVMAADNVAVYRDFAGVDGFGGAVKGLQDAEKALSDAKQGENESDAAFKTRKDGLQDAVDTAKTARDSAANALAAYLEETKNTSDTPLEDLAEQADYMVTAYDEAVAPGQMAIDTYDKAKAAAKAALDGMIFAGMGAGAAGSGDDSTDVTARYRVNMDIIQETDSGLKLEGRVRLQGDNGTTAKLAAPRFSVSHGGLRLDMGNVGGAIDNLPGYYGNEPGLTAVAGQYSGANFAIDGYSSTGNGEGNNIQLSYGVGGFRTTLSWSDDGAGTEYGGMLADSEQTAFNVSWSDDAMTFAVGYATGSARLESAVEKMAKDIGLGSMLRSYDSSMLVATAQAKLQDLGLTVLFGTEDHDADPNGLYFDTFYGLSANYRIGAATNLIFSYGDGSATFDKQQIGVGITHDLGGAMLKAGIAQSKISGAYEGMRMESENTTADFGVQFNF